MKATALIIFTVTLTALGGRSTAPPTAVLGEVESIGADEQVVGTDPSVQILDALCISHEATPDQC
ncbi:MAG: hypothetical protein ABIQ73_03120 [Acidimicrobiales bacterium]